MANEKREKEKMEEINHFGHEEHPLKLIENSEMVKGVHCHRCQEPILGGYVYSCISCPYFLHKTCAELQPTLPYVNHPFPLTLVACEDDWFCDVCLNDYKSGEFSYWCSVCDFDACLNCGDANAALMEKALVKFQEEGQHAFLHHFAHSEHPLMLIVWETIIGIVGVDFGNNEEKPKGFVVGCDLCEEPLSIGDSAYACTQCRFFLHKLCSKLPDTINLPSLYQHPLGIEKFKNNDTDLVFCYVCSQRITGGFCYGINEKDAGRHFNACSNCFLVEFARKAEADAIKEEAKIKIEHKGHPQHPLTLKLRPASFHCDACNEKDEGLFYECDTCDFWIHKSCATLAPTIHLPHHHPKHPLVLVYSLPDKFYRYPYYCKFCNKYIRRDEWLYHCANCRYIAHIKCAMNALQQPSTPRDNLSPSAASDNEISLPLHFPMSEAFTDPLKLLHSKIFAQDDNETTEINHWRHPAHPLFLNVEDPRGNNMILDINSGDPIKVCYACVRPLSFPYYSCKEDGCSVVTDLHKYCAHLPRTLQHQLHPDHTLDLVDTWEDEEFYDCTGCYSYGNTFAYKCKMNCKFCFCVNCAFLPNTIKHISHEHPLTQLIDPKIRCNACDKWSDGISCACKDCDFILDMYCAMRSPQSLAHRYCKGHEIPLTYPPVDHPEDFYCDICEKEMDPKFPLYHCHNHKSRSSFHLRCISRIDYYANIWFEGTETRAYHRHPLTYARRKKTPKYVCSVCNQDINGYLVLECRAKTCNFIICYQCDRNKEW